MHEGAHQPPQLALSWLHLAYNLAATFVEYSSKHGHA